MPKESGRSGKPGNERAMRRIDIHTPRPDLLQPGASRPNKTYSAVVDRGKSVPGWSKNFNGPKKTKKY